MSQVCHWQFRTLVSKKGKFSLSYLLVQFVWEHWIILWNFWGTILRYEPKMHIVKCRCYWQFEYSSLDIQFCFCFCIFLTCFLSDEVNSLIQYGMARFSRDGGIMPPKSHCNNQVNLVRLLSLEQGITSMQVGYCHALSIW